MIFPFLIAICLFDHVDDIFGLNWGRILDRKSWIFSCLNDFGSGYGQVVFSGDFSSFHGLGILNSEFVVD